MTPDDSQLPFLIVHGAIVWKGLLVAIVAAAFGGWQWWRWRAARAAMREEASAWLAATTPKVEDGARTVRGILRDGAWSTRVRQPKRYGDPQEVEVLPADGAPWIDCGGERVELAGEVRVVAGGAARGGPRRSVVRSVSSGTEIVVDGKLRHRASADEAGYREAAGGWILEPDGGVPARVVAVRPRARPFPSHAVTPFVFVAVAALGSYHALKFVGRRALDRLDDRQFADDGRPVELGSFDAYAIAAAMPGSRAAAVRMLDARLQFHPYHDTSSLRRALAVAELDEGCAGVVDRLHDTQWYGDAIATAERCKLAPALRARSLAANGEYAAALAAYGEAAPTQIAIAAGDWARAAELAGREADASSRPSTYSVEDADDVRRRHRRELRQRCLAAVFAERSGGPPAAARLAELAAQPDGEACALIAAAVAPDAGRGEALLALYERWAEIQGDHDLASLGFVALELAWGDGVGFGYLYSSFYDASRAIAGEVRPGHWLAPWSRQALIAAGADVSLQAVATTWLAVLDVVRGDLDGARARAAEVAHLVAGVEDLEQRARHFASALELRGTRVELAPSERYALGELVSLRRGDKVSFDVSVGPTDCERDYQDAIRAAGAGDGRPLADVMQRCTVYWRTGAGHLLAVLPRVTSHREALIEPLRAMVDDSAMVNPAYGAAAYASLRRDLLRFVGDGDAERWHAIALRHAAVWDDRDRVVALLLWDP